jgi:NAD(P)-dependent dehydrogenase (short-subunit alcohol dehydrogenase family)
MSTAAKKTRRAAVVTGGSAGIGAATASALADSGYSVLVTGRRREALDRVGGRSRHIHPVQADVREPSAAARIIAEVERRFGRLDVLVNNAGLFSAASLTEADSELMSALFETNVYGPTYLFQAALPLLEASGGAVINVTSTLARKAVPDVGLYGASKAALEQLTRSWALLAAPIGVRVNAVAPGPVETGILEASGLESDEVDRIKAAERRSIPLGRRGEPEEIASWIVFLADDQTRWVSGQVLGVDGGLSAT